MQKILLTLVAATCLVAAGAALSQTQGSSSGPQQDRPGMMMQSHGSGERSADNSSSGGMMGHGGGMMTPAMGDHGRGAGRSQHMGPGMLTMMMIMMDVNADRAVSLEEFQAVHARMFKYADADNDGKLTFGELRSFHSGEMNLDRN